MSFGFHTIVDLLSWTVAILLSIKVAATVILLSRDRTGWFESRSGPLLWWSTKITPLLALPCMIAIASIRHEQSDFWVFTGLLVFVAVAVPLVVWNRFYRRRA